jgi:hypothetical protein
MHQDRGAKRVRRLGRVLGRGVERVVRVGDWGAGESGVGAVEFGWGRGVVGSATLEYEQVRSIVCVAFGMTR